MKRVTKKITLSILFLFVFLFPSVSFAETAYQFTGLISPLEWPTSKDLLSNSGLDNGPWPMFRHDVTHKGRGASKGPDFSWLDWSYQKGTCSSTSANSSPATGSDGTVYVGSYCNEFVYAINADGTLKWKYQMGNPTITSPAVASDGTVYINSDDGYLYAINPDGTLKWRYDICGRNYVMGSSPAIGPNGTIYLGTCGYLYAINPDGTLKWQYYITDTAAIKSSPAISSDGTIYIGSFDTYLYAVNSDGTLKWRYQTGDYVRSSPAIGPNGTIYIWSEDDYLYAIDPDGILKWKYLITYTYSLGGAIGPSPAIGSDGTIYMGSNVDNHLHAINSDGSMKWKYQLDYFLSGSPILDSEGTIYIGEIGWPLSGPFGAVNAINQDGTLKARFVSSEFYSISLNIAGGQRTIAVSVHDRLYMIGIPEGICGTVTDMTTGLYIGYAQISADGEEVQLEQSAYYCVALEPGIYDVVCSRTGYQSITIPNVVISAAEITELNIELTTPGPLNIVTTSLIPAEVGFDYNDRVRISGGIYPYTYSIAYGSLPPGLSLDAVYGYIIGTPTVAGAYAFSVAVEDAEAAYAERYFTIEVTQSLAIITESPLPRGTRDTGYYVDLEAVGGSAPYTFTKVSGILPPGISLYSDGNLSGTPSNAGAYQFTAKVTDLASRTAEKLFDLEIVNPLVITTPRLNDGVVGESYNQTLMASGGYGTYHWELYSGILPDGLTLNSANGTLSGTPTEATVETIEISVTDEDARVAYKDFSLQISDPLQILTTSLPDGVRCEPYSEAVDIDGGIQPFIFSYVGQLPAGLTLDTSTGVVSGMPTIPGYTNFSITVEDGSYPTAQSATQNFGVRIIPQSQKVCPGDFDGDGDVDGSDLAAFAGDFGRTDCGCECYGDFGGDGDVDGSDLATFAADFGRTDCP